MLTINDKVIAILDLKGWTQSKLAEELETSQPTVHRWTKGVTPEGKHWDEINALYAKLIPAGAVIPPNAKLGETLSGLPVKIPLYGSAVGGEDGEFALNGNHLDDIMAPPMLSGVNGAYAVSIAGESMVPRYFDGEIAFIDPRKRVTRGDFVIAQIRHKNDGEAPYAYVKRFVRHTQNELVLEQFNPPKELRFPHEDVVSVHFIVMAGRAG